MTILSCELQCGELYTDPLAIGERREESGEARGMSYDGEMTVRICNDAAENGEDQEPGPLTWLNSARIVTDTAEDAVHCLVSIGDPRGAFCFTVRRRPDTGTIIIHMPHPDEGFAHKRTKQLHPGTLEVVSHDGQTVSYADPEPEEEEDDDE